MSVATNGQLFFEVHMLRIKYRQYGKVMVSYH
jgi:hypothetical protein